MSARFIKYTPTTALDEKLGPIDLGPEIRWMHYRYPGEPATLCGILRSGPITTPPPGRRLCPDCARVWDVIRTRGYR